MNIERPENESDLIMDLYLPELIQGKPGEQGPPGVSGADGKSAFELAQQEGFAGSMNEWLASLKGSRGEAGDSAYQIAVNNGFQGTEAEWLESLKASISGYLTADQIEYEETNVKLVLDDLYSKMNDLTYKAVEIALFANNVGITELGSTIDTIVFTWVINKIPVTLLFEGESIDASLNQKTIEGVGLRANRTFTLKATDEKNNSSIKSTSVIFTNGVYYGVSSNTSDFNSDFILTLTKRLQSSKAITFRVVAGIDQYIYYALPSRYGVPVFTVGGFDGGFTRIASFEFINSSGYAEEYDLWVSDNLNLGDTVVVVS